MFSPTRRTFLQTALATAASLFLPRFLLAGRNPRQFWFLHSATWEAWTVDDPVAWSLDHARQPILERARERLVTQDAADPQRVIRLVVRRCGLNLIELRPGRVPPLGGARRSENTYACQHRVMIAARGMPCFSSVTARNARLTHDSASSSWVVALPASMQPCVWKRPSLGARTSKSSSSVVRTSSSLRRCFMKWSPANSRPRTSSILFTSYCGALISSWAK